MTIPKWHKYFMDSSEKVFCLFMVCMAVSCAVLLAVYLWMERITESEKHERQMACIGKYGVEELESCFKLIDSPE